MTSGRQTCEYCGAEVWSTTGTPVGRCCATCVRFIAEWIGSYPGPEQAAVRALLRVAPKLRSDVLDDWRWSRMRNEIDQAASAVAADEDDPFADLHDTKHTGRYYGGDMARDLRPTEW